MPPHLLFDDTIVAEATGVRHHAIAVIRVSGTHSKSIFSSLMPVPKLVPRHVYYTKLYNQQRQFLDDVQLAFFASPHSYTGEDSFEVYCHGNHLIVRDIIEHIKGLGARLAEPGEFTKRAYMHGKLNLAEAESVADVIGAYSQAMLEQSRKNREGRLAKEVQCLREDLIHLLTLAEAEIDFNDQDLEVYSIEKMKKALVEIQSKVDVFLSYYQISKRIRQGYKVCIVGAPNVGKSTIFNSLVKNDRVLVSEHPGTTRDVVSETMEWNGVAITLFDTAGIRDTSDPIEKAGIELTYRYAQEADLVLYVEDAQNIGNNRNINLFPDEMLRRNLILVINKIDLIESSQVAEVFDNNKTVKISNRYDYSGVLLSLIHKQVVDNQSLGDFILINERQYEIFYKAQQFLIKADQNVMKPDILSYELQNAADIISDIIGEIKNEDVLDSIFSHFCIGK